MTPVEAQVSIFLFNGAKKNVKIYLIKDNLVGG
jgi:hypothetical protein